jgi:serine/threonine protein kinase
MISDFGAARIRKRDINGTGGPWEMGQRGPYAAPECIRDRTVGRAADVWSLGCIFAEFLTWAAGGSVRVKEFQEMRKTIRADANGNSIGYADFSFHQNGNVKDSVRDWLDQYDNESISSDNRVQFVRIVKKMLRVGVMEDEKSISAGEVNEELGILFPSPATPNRLSLSQEIDPSLRLLKDLSDLDTVSYSLSRSLGRLLMNHYRFS